MNARITQLLLWSVMSTLVDGCAHTGKPQTARELRGRGMIIDSGLAKDATPKYGINAISDTGNIIFSSGSYLPNTRDVSSIGGGSKMSFPRWVRVTWREDPGIDYKHGVFVGGTIIGDYTIEVLSRIPEEVFAYAGAARGRVIVTRFRIKDDGVLLAWDVQETVTHPPSGGNGWVWSMHGGDFPCETSPNQSHPSCTEGRLEDAPWYNPLWTRN